MERENEAPAELVFPAGCTEPSSKTYIRLERTLWAKGFKFWGAFALVSTVSVGVAAKTSSAGASFSRFSQSIEPHLFPLLSAMENEAPAEQVFQAGRTKPSSKTCIRLERTLWAKGFKFWGLSRWLVQSA